MVGLIDIQAAVPLLYMGAEQTLHRGRGDNGQVATDVGTAHVVAQPGVGRQDESLEGLQVLSHAIDVYVKTPTVAGQYHISF